MQIGASLVRFFFANFILSVQAWSLSYHAASGVIATGTSEGQVEIWQTAAYDPCDVSAAPPSHACVRTRLRIAQLQLNAAESILSKVDNGLCQQVSREQELRRSIADLEAKRALISSRISILLISD